MSEYFDYEAFLFLKNENEISEIVNNNPFNKAEDLHIYVFVGIEDVETLLMEEFSKSDKAENENAQIVADTFYYKPKCIALLSENCLNLFVFSVSKL